MIKNRKQYEKAQKILKVFKKSMDSSIKSFIELEENHRKLRLEIKEYKDGHNK